LKKRGIIILIIAASVAIISLIGIQVYWVKISLESQQKKFDQTVMNTLSEVIQKLEREEAITQVTSKLFREDEFNENTNDSILSIEKFPLNDPFVDNSIVKGSNNGGVNDDQYVINFTPSSKLDSSIFIIRKTQKRVLRSNINTVVSGGDSLLKNQIQKKAVLINDIVNELALISISKGLNERVESEKIDSLIQLELIESGINIPYSFDVFDAETQSLSFHKDSEELLNTPYKISLFPNDYFIESDQLLIHFPNQFKYVIRDSWKVLSISFLLVLILIGIFYASIATIFRQKRLSLVKNDFINNMTHELKTPISTISLACEALSDESLALEEQSRNSYVKMIQEENTRLSLLVDNVLKSAVWDSTELELNLQNLRVNSLIQSVVNSFEIQLKQLGGSLTSNLNAKKDLVLLDQIHFTNVIYNLLDNAKKYGRENPKVKIETSNESENVVVKISDNGIGISKAEQKKIFDKFYRVPTGNIHDVKGFGLGLSYVKRIIELLGGEIEIESLVNSGTTIILKLKKNE
jgi:two-component system phosphate regulon sensor histidine kinase PhoR